MAFFFGVLYSGKFYFPKGPELAQVKLVNDVSLNEQTAIMQHNISTYPGRFRPKNVDEFTDLIQFCTANNMRVIVAVAPVPDSIIWCTDKWDTFL